jgi:hypothetical protein
VPRQNEETAAFAPFRLRRPSIPGPPPAFPGHLDTNASLAKLARHATLTLAQFADHQRGHDAIGGLSRGTHTSRFSEEVCSKFVARRNPNPARAVEYYAIESASRQCERLSAGSLKLC